MPASATSAVVLRSRVGRNLIIHTQGIDNRDAVNSVTEAVKILQASSANADPGDIAATVQGLPLACGSICIYHDRWRVLYRVIGHMVMFFIVPSFTNTLHALDFLERAVRVVTLDFRSVETTPEKLWRRYPEAQTNIHEMLGPLEASNKRTGTQGPLGELTRAIQSGYLEGRGGAGTFDREEFLHHPSVHVKMGGQMVVVVKALAQQEFMSILAANLLVERCMCLHCAMLTFMVHVALVKLLATFMLSLLWSFNVLVISTRKWCAI
ncbi:hypothetical protein DUNSADRAFT_14894 [Dunaliella salina]|uniref:Uncharacterized protein n=1 Tax=Dunaliella salina TaxID=3046 RepID=A0ABQ7G6H4_DUNSA|nr:hypothetical protein DUNSADRAFT_14894 [Dunaliella salina]|eukprot:KAF5830207.1 hypothetical protein DUNSADRAFT_14894 [Dunaliella salina]